MTATPPITQSMPDDTYPSILPNGAALSRKVRILAPYPRYLSCRVGKQEAGLDISDFLMRRFPFRTLAAWEDRLALGLVSQDGRALRPGDRLLPEPPLEFANPAQLEPSVPDETAILENNDDYLLVYKPAPLPVHPGGRYNRNTLLSILREQNLAKSKPLLVLHRLDSVTSGLVLFGRNPAFSRTVHVALARGGADKTYLALVRGLPAEDRISVDSPIRRKHGYVFECHESGKGSRTDFEVLQRYDDCALVRCRPHTGRTHQIRLHLREWGHPVVDDPVYGDTAFGNPASGNPASGDLVYGDGISGYPARGNARTPSVYEPVKAVQNRAISLLHCRLQIPEQDLDFRLSDHMAEPAVTGSTAQIPVPQAFAGADLRFLLD
jgi:RluA family pseudouridine synthase